MHGPLVGDALQESFQARTGPVDFFREAPSSAFRIRKLLAQLPILLAQPQAQVQGLPDFRFQSGQLNFHRRTIVSKTLNSQGLRNQSQCRFMQIPHLDETDTMRGLVQVSRLDSYPPGVKRETGEGIMN